MWFCDCLEIMATHISDTESWEGYTRELGMNLRRIRNKRGYSQEHVAYGAGLSKVQYQRLESGGFKGDSTPNPTAKTLIAIAEVLDVSLGEILPEPWPDLRAR